MRYFFIFLYQVIRVIGLIIVSTSCGMLIFLIKNILFFIPGQWHWPILNKVILDFSKRLRGILKSWVRVEIKYKGFERISNGESAILIANHTSLLDALFLWAYIQPKTSFMKYFLKSTLKWVPVIGYTAYALGFPFIDRPSLGKCKRKIIKEQKEQRKRLLSMCAEVFSTPSTLVIFVEGTRINEEKKQSSPFEYLLKPKYTGLALSLLAGKKHVRKLVDVTIHYPKLEREEHLIWKVMTAQLNVPITIEANVIEVESIPEMVGLDDKKSKQEFSKWLDDLWWQKDKLLDQYSKAVMVETDAEINEVVS